MLFSVGRDERKERLGLEAMRREEDGMAGWARRAENKRH